MRVAAKLNKRLMERLNRVMEARKHDRETMHLSENIADIIRQKVGEFCSEEEDRMGLDG